LEKGGKDMRKRNGKSNDGTISPLTLLRDLLLSMGGRKNRNLLEVEER